VGRLSIPISDHRAIRRDKSGQFGVRATVRKLAGTIAAVATNISGEGEYGVEETVGSDRTRLNVWAKNHDAAKDESGPAPPLMQAGMQVKP
jgi:hypothetical protein